MTDEARTHHHQESIKETTSFSMIRGKGTRLSLLLVSLAASVLLLLPSSRNHGGVHAAKGGT